LFLKPKHIREEKRREEKKREEKMEACSETNYIWGRNNKFLAMKVPRQCSLFPLAGVHLRKGKALVTKKDIELGCGLCYG
jgi:hypothetical protein